MIEETLLKSNYIGKDGFIWWLGQVAPPEVWDVPEKTDIDFTKFGGAWPYRCKVRIIGYHTYNREELSDNDLPWAHVMLSPTDGNAQGGLGKTHKLIGGETVFGFFLDGDDAQQPVITGVIYRNSNVESFDIDEIAYKPFKGAGGKGSRIVQGATKQTPKKVKTNEPSTSSGNIINGEMKTPISGTIIDSGSDKTGTDKFFPVDKALAKAYATVEKEKILSENGCDDNVIGKITRAIQNFISVISGIESYLDTYIDPVLNTVVDITNEIRRTATIVLGSLKFLVNNMRNMIMKLVGTAFSSFVGLVVPIPQQPIVGEATKNILNIIFCLFEKVLDFLLPYLEDMLKGLVGRAINAPLCAIEEFTATLLNKMIDIIDGLLGPVMSGLNWLLSGYSQIRSLLSSASSIATQLFNLIGCDNLKCQTPSEWALNLGPIRSQYDNWNRVINKMNVIRGFNDDLDFAVSSLSIYGSGEAIFRDCSDRVRNPRSQSDLVNSGNILYTCIPPEVEIYGDGIGAQAIAIVGDNGSILSIEIVNPGYGYSKPPSISIIDKSKYGTGAKAACTIRNGRVEKIYLLSSGSGYCKTNIDGLIRNPYYIVVADRYSFYEGEVCTFTIVTENVPDGTILSYRLGGDIDSGDIDGPLVGNITIFNNTFTVPIKTRQDSERELVEQLNFDLLNEGGDIVARAVVLINDRLSPTLQFTPPNSIQSPPGTIIPIGEGNVPQTPGIGTFFPISGIGTVNSGILTGIVIPNPGIGYTDGDTITVGDCVLTPIVSPNGSIVGVSSLFCPTEFTSLPGAIIDSNNGEGASIYPVLEYKQVGILTSIALNQFGVIKVVDCV